MSSPLDLQCINTLRFLSVDMVQHAGSGHPGLPLGAATMAYALWTRHMKHHPAHPHWPDRDRFVLSAGHGSALLYSLLHMTGYDLSLDDLKQFRQWGSKAPGHPECGHTPGVEITTGPLGQGLANAVGMAIAEAHLAARYNRGGHQPVDHRTWALVSDGDLMEGVAAEAASLAGHLRLGELVCLYDDNRVTLSAGTDITFSEDSALRFRSYGWQTLRVDDGNDIDAVNAALDAARAETKRPTLILVRTHIGFGSPEQDSFKAHGSPLGVDGREAHQAGAGLAAGAALSCSAGGTRTLSTGTGTGRTGRGGVERAHAGLRRSIPSALCRIAGPPARRTARGLGRGDTVIPRRRQGHGHPRRRRDGPECDGVTAASALRRFGRPGPVDPHGDERTGHLQPARQRWR